MGFVLHVGRTPHPRARVLGAEQGIARFPEPWAAWLQSHRIPVSQLEASSGRSTIGGPAALVAGAERWEGDSSCWRKLSLLQRLSGKGASWALFSTGVHQNMSVRVILMGSQAQ